MAKLVNQQHADRLCRDTYSYVALYLLPDCCFTVQGRSGSEYVRVVHGCLMPAHGRLQSRLPSLGVFQIGLGAAFGEAADPFV